MGNIDVSMDVSVLFLATAIAEMKMDELSGVSRYIFIKFHSGGAGHGERRREVILNGFYFCLFKLVIS